MSKEEMVVAGIDTHKDVHVLCLLDADGRKVFTGAFSADGRGYDDLIKTIGDPELCTMVGVEGTASYGAGLTRRLLECGYEVVEVLRPKRAKRRIGKDKNDFVDAERAARDALSGIATSTPKTQDGWVEAIRFLQASRRIATQTSTAVINAAKALLATAPEHIKDKYLKMNNEDMMRTLGRKRHARNEVEGSIYTSLRSLAHLWIESNRQATALEKDMEDLLKEHALALLDILVVVLSLPLPSSSRLATIQKECEARLHSHHFVGSVQ